MTADRKPGFNTLAIHAGAQPDPATGARATPIYQTTSFVFDDVDHAAALFNLETFGNIYSRIMNPTQAVLEERVAALEGGTAGLAGLRVMPRRCWSFTPCWSRATISSPRASFTAARSTSSPTPSRNATGCAMGRHHRSGVVPRRADAEDQGDLRRVIANPGGIVTDLAAVAAIAKAAGVPLIVDNTLATPYLIRPIEHGADIIVHSLTKFLGGHGNSIGGAIVDCGTFDWLKSGRYPTLSAPSASYHGITLAETFGNFAFAIACRVLGCAIWPGDFAVQRLPYFDRDRDPAIAHAAPLRQCA